MILTEETYRARRYVAAYAFIGPLLMAALINVSDSAQQVQLGIVTAISLLIALIIYVVLGAVKVRIDRQGIVYQSMLKDRVLNWDNVRSVYVKRKHTGKSSYRVLIFENPEGKQVVTMNIALFSRRTLQAVCSAATELAPQAQFDDQARAFAAGTFPWYIR
ncbi:MAG: hypothetical protein EOO15_08190 [Chitinophagaceae bacterium]|nr:MAG: hypothetical protein EOO15_08190 [Chitinophagaceae bacterium]